jgi:regulator of protease activity HflC (stomatin/prohibitin superfamily)
MLSFIISVIVGIAVFTLSTIYSGIHQIREGHVGMYWRGGHLLNRVTYPGYRVKIPYLDSVEEIQVTMQTDSVRNIPCGTSGGVMVYFEKVEVVNRLPADKALNTVRLFGPHYDKMWIYDKIHHEINQFCSSHTLSQVYIELFDTLDESLAKALQTDCDKYDTGIQIIAVRVTKPSIPSSIAKSYEEVEQQRTQRLIALKKHDVKVQEAETAKEVRKVEIEKEVMEQEGIARIAKIQNEVESQKQKTKADAIAYSITSEATANQARFTPEFLTYTMLISLSNNTKLFFGDSIPKAFALFQDEASLRSLLVPKSAAQH